MGAGGPPQWSRWAHGNSPYTVGIEEEVMLIDSEDHSLYGEFEHVVACLRPELTDRLAAETNRASLELASEPHSRVADAVGDLQRMRVALHEDLAEQGVEVAAVATHPFARWEQAEVSEQRRYRYVHETMKELARREPTYALHVHVGLPDPDTAIVVANRMRAHLPLLLALSANSPYWQGRDSGLASARTPIFGAFPRVGIPREFDGYRDFVDALSLLIDSGAFPDPSFVWWDLRLRPGYGTIEIRIMDVQSESWRTAALAALVQSTVRLEAEDGFASERLIRNREVLEENRFLAFRDGTEAELLDPAGRRAVAVSELTAGLLEACTPHARELGCEEDLADVPALLAEPGDRVQRELAGNDDERGPARVLDALCARFPLASRPTAAVG